MATAAQFVQRGRRDALGRSNVCAPRRRGGWERSVAPLPSLICNEEISR
jgi:hypothetical protein